MSKIKKYIQYLLKQEKISEFSLMWGHRGDGTLWISTCGYKVMEHHNIEAQLLKLGCRYNFDYPLQVYTSDNCRTETTFNVDRVII